MIEDWVKLNPRAFIKKIYRPHQYRPYQYRFHHTLRIHASASNKDKRWYLSLNYRTIADFETFEELDGMVPILVNAYFRSRE